MPITADNFDNALPATPTNLGPPGTVVSTMISGLIPNTKYDVAVRPMSACGQTGDLINAQGQTQAATYTTLSGCFIATATYGSAMAGEVAMLRRFRDERLLKSPLGQAAVASYYALSPALATVIADNEGLRALSRRALAPIVAAAKASLSVP
jgi:hypothetical protein